MLKFVQNWSAINIMQQVVIVFWLVWKPFVVNEDIVKPPNLLGFVCHTNERYIFCRWQSQICT